MNIIVPWPLRINIPNKASYQRIKTLSEHYDLYLVTMFKEKIDPSIRCRIKRIVSVPRISIVSYVLYAFAVLYAFLLTLRRSGTKSIIYVIYNWTVLPAMIVSMIFGVKVFVDLLDDPEYSTEKLKNMRPRPLKYWIYSLINRLFHCFASKTNRVVGFCAVGLSENSVLPRMYIKRYSIDPERMLTVPNGVDLSVTRPVKKQNNIGFLRIIYVTVVGKHREVHVLIENLRKIETLDFELVLIGNIEGSRYDQQWLNNLIADNKWVSYKGRLPHSEVLGWIGRSDVGIYMASKDVANYRYTHPVKVSEYLGMGKPVIAPRFEGVMEIVKEGYNGFLFDPNCPEEVADIITEHAAAFINGDFSQNALESVKDLDWAKLNPKFLSFFQTTSDN